MLRGPSLSMAHGGGKQLHETGGAMGLPGHMKHGTGRGMVSSIVIIRSFGLVLGTARFASLRRRLKAELRTEVFDDWAEGEGGEEGESADEEDGADEEGDEEGGVGGESSGAD